MNYAKLATVLKGAFGFVTVKRNPLTGEMAIQAGGKLLSTAGYDVVVFGGTAAGVSAAVGAARQNKRVLLISESERLGGMVGWGITFQDVVVDESPASVVGFAKEFFTRIALKDTFSYRSHQRFHRQSYGVVPSWFARAFNELTGSTKGIDVLYNTPTVRAVNKSGARITSAVFEQSNGAALEVQASQFVDASYPGDLIAAAGCTVQIGRESSATYSETLAGIVAPTTFPGGVSPDPYITPGVPASGLLPWVEPTVGTVGAGDGRVMAFNFRICITNNAGARGTWPAPNMATYNPQNYELLARAMALSATSYNAFSKVFVLYQHSVNNTIFDMNTAKGVSSNYPGEALCREYITASEARRIEIRETIKQHILGLIYWIKNSGDARIPAALVTDAANYGPLATELVKYGNISPELYVREGRRLVGDFVLDYNKMTLANGLTYSDIVAYGYYQFDSHQSRIVLNGSVAALEGSINAILTQAQSGYVVPYRCMVPKVSECTNLISPTCPSVSRIAWLSVRLEPMLMAMGYAAGVGAAHAIDQGATIGSVSVSLLNRALDIKGVFEGIVLDTSGTYPEGTVTKGSWTDTSSDFGFIGSAGVATPTNAADLTFAPIIPETRAYRVQCRYMPSTTRTTLLNATINHAGGASVVAINQRYGAAPEGRGGDWEELGTYVFTTGAPSVNTVVFSKPSGTDTATMSAVRWIPA